MERELLSQPTSDGESDPLEPEDSGSAIQDLGPKFAEAFEVKLAKAFDVDQDGSSDPGNDESTFDSEEAESSDLDHELPSTTIKLRAMIKARDSKIERLETQLRDMQRDAKKKEKQTRKEGNLSKRE